MKMDATLGTDLLKVTRKIVRYLLIFAFLAVGCTLLVKAYLSPLWTAGTLHTLLSLLSVCLFLVIFRRKARCDSSRGSASDSESERLRALAAQQDVSASQLVSLCKTQRTPLPLTEKTLCPEEIRQESVS